MFISSREKVIIEKLLSKHEEITINDLAKEIEVSSRTIHRDLNGIEKLLQEYNLELTRKTGVGIQITGSADSKEQLKRKLITFTLQDYMAEERQTLILCTLYEAAGPVKLFTLANELQVTVATISNDLLKLEEQLAPFQLSILRKRGYGVELNGPEKAKRRAISYIISKTLNEDEFLSLIRKSMEKKSAIQESTISERLLHLIDREKLLIIEDVIRDLHEQALIAMTDSAYVGLIVHVALAIDRIRQGEKIEMAYDFLEQLKEEPEYDIAKKIIEQLAIRFEIEIPNAEIGYITMHLQGAKLRTFEENMLEANSFQIVMQAKKLIQEVEKLTDCKLSNQAPLLEGLVTHLRPALYRIEQSMAIINPLLENIKRDYEELFHVIENACEAAFPDLQIPDEEVGFLVLHFGAAILGLKKESKLQAYIVCSSGIGTSKMLATQLRREVPEIEDIYNVSAFELNELPITERDLVISTIHLQTFPNEYILVSPFLTEQEIQQVQMYAKRKMLLQQTALPVKENLLNGEEIMERMKSIHLYTGAMTTLLENFHLTKMQNDLAIRSCIQEACQQLEAEGIIQDATVVTAALFDREAIGGLGIPSTEMALFHTKHPNVRKPSFTIYTLREPIKMKAMDESEMDVTQLLVMLAPKPFDNYGLEVLSQISALIIESDQSVELFQSEDGELIHAYLAKKFDQFIQEKIKMI